MILRRKMQDFKVREDGSLLIFFAVCIMAILGIVALSFDMGRRASTQTDMQSFADNVALAAAGELNGQADAITRARAAAQNAIIAANETLKSGASGAAATLTFDPVDDLIFYSDLPESDTPTSFTVSGLTTSKYQLPTTDIATTGEEAAFVGVRLTTVDVNWMFANVFGSANLPDEAVGAVAIAGNAGYTCEIAPLMVCLPRDSSGNNVTLPRGQGIRLQTVGHNAAWNPGEFGYLNIDQIFASGAGGPCADENPESRRQACMLAQGLDYCFSGRGVDIQTGQRGGQEPAGFNLPFGIFGQAMNNLRNDPIYRTGPHSISGQIQNNSCRADGLSPDTMAFPPDPCLTNGTNGASTCGGTGSRFGDNTATSPTWDRTQYVNTNYSFNKPDGTFVEGTFFDFPQENLTRYEYYLLEIERARNGGYMAETATGPYATDQLEGPGQPNRYVRDNVRGPVNNYNTWDDYWDNISTGFNPIIPDAHGRVDNGLPQCAQVQPSDDIGRRVIVIAGIDCPPVGEEGRLTGDEDNVPVVQYYTVFLLSPARDIQGGGGGSNGPLFELFVEVIDPIGSEDAGASVTASSAFRQLVQLYR